MQLYKQYIVQFVLLYQSQVVFQQDSNHSRLTPAVRRVFSLFNAFSFDVLLPTLITNVTYYYLNTHL